MRPSQEAIDVILSAVRDLAGSNARLRLFGSRVDDAARGGDIDLLLELSVPATEPAQLASALAGRISRALDGRAADVPISAPNLRHLPIHDEALASGIPL